MFYFYAVYLLTMNILSFALMGADKSFAKKRMWRIPEKVLFAMTILGGSLGGVLGMQLFRHKTKHLSFVIVFPLCFAVYCGISVFLFQSGIITLP